MAEPQDPSAFNIGMPPQGTQPSPIHEFFKDPKNLATGLVFLAALAQGRKPGQSTAGLIGERALGAAAFRGGIDASQRKKGIQDEAIANERLQQSRENEFRGRQVAIGEQGLDLQRSGQSQAARLAADQNANIAAVSAADNASREKINTDNIEAGRWNARHATGADKSPLGGENLSALIQAQWKQELTDASLQGRPPDPMKMANSVADLMQALSVIQPGASLVRNPDGSIARYVPRPGDPAVAPPGAPVEPSAPTPRSVFLNPADVTAKPTPKRPITPAEAQQNAQVHQGAELSAQAQAFTTPSQVDAYITKFGARLSKDQLKALAQRKREMLSKDLLEASTSAAGRGVK